MPTLAMLSTSPVLPPTQSADVFARVMAVARDVQLDRFGLAYASYDRAFSFGPLSLMGYLSDMLSAKHMPKGPKGQKRPADVVSDAVTVMKIATGEIAETLTEDGKNAAAVELGRKGGQARAASLSAKKKSAIAASAANARWAKRQRRSRAKKQST